MKIELELDAVDEAVAETMRRLRDVGCAEVRARLQGAGGGDGVSVSCSFEPSLRAAVETALRALGYDEFELEGNLLIAS